MSAVYRGKKKKSALLCTQKIMRMSFWRLRLSRREPITVILSVSVSSTVLTQLPEDGELARFNHPLTHNVMITHTARRQVHGCSFVTALSPHQIRILSLSSYAPHNTSLCKLELRLLRRTAHPYRELTPQIQKGLVCPNVCKGLINITCGILLLLTAQSFHAYVQHTTVCARYLQYR